MRSRTSATILIGAAVLFTAAACGSNNTSTATAPPAGQSSTPSSPKTHHTKHTRAAAPSSPNSPAATEFNPPGDSPDTTVFVPFALSGAVQAVVSKREMRRLMPDDSPKTLAVATGLGAASSSCSYASVALARSLFRKGADFTASMALATSDLDSAATVAIRRPPVVSGSCSAECRTGGRRRG